MSVRRPRPRSVQYESDESMDKEKRVRLKGVLEHSASSAQIRDDGSLVIEFYDFGPDAEEWFGHDVAFLLVISSEQKEQMLVQILGEGKVPSGPDERDEVLLRELGERFEDYYAVKKWVAEHGIVYEKEFDSWA